MSLLAFILTFIFLQSTSSPVQVPSIFSNLGVIIAIAVGIVTIIGVCIRIGMYFGKHNQKIQELETDANQNIKPSIAKIDKKIDENIIPALNTIGNGVAFIQGAMGVNKNSVTVSQSPLVLNEKGFQILNDSGISKIIDDNYSVLLLSVKNKNPENAYQAQEIIKDVVKELLDDPILKNTIEIGAFSCGSDVETVLYVGAINIRDKILNELNLYPKDIDTFDPNKSK